MFNVRGSSSVLPNWFAAGSTYAIRVFAMRADWDGFWHRTENVTPHSAIVTFTVPSCIPATTTTVALTCAQGGTCVVGDTGPGGGIVFYVHDDADDLFTSTGSDCGASCRYLEAATGDQSAGVAWATTVTACYDDASASSNNNCRLNSVYSGNTAAQTASRTGSNAIGKGMENTNQVYARLTTVGLVATSAYAAGIAWAYSNNGKADWHLPSKDELNQLYQRRDTVGGFSNNYWWSSSENDLAGAWYQYFFNGNQFADTKEYDLRVRPVRAFG
ncbi:MAG: DUF1566 domain-containing protein [Actinobacteria bacterium]|nr:DUF1566 domain-containing protein [Actinomycetota bacterium]